MRIWSMRNSLNGATMGGHELDKEKDIIVKEKEVTNKDPKLR